MSFSQPIKWNGQLVGYVEEIEPETVQLGWYKSLSKLRGLWVPLSNQATRDFLEQVEEHQQVEVNAGEHAPGRRTLFCLGSDDDAWLLVLDSEEYIRELFPEVQPWLDDEEST